MTDAERDELIEKSLLKELDAVNEARVQQLRHEDLQFGQEYDFQEKLIQQVRLKRRQELLNLFSDFETEQANDKEGIETPVIPLVNASHNDVLPANPPVISLWRQSWFRVAAGVVLAALLGVTIWWQLARYDTRPIATTREDSTNTQTPTDTPQLKPDVPAPIPAPSPMGPVAQSIKPAQLEGPTRLPYYETEDSSLGFGKGQQTRNYRTVVFNSGYTPSYEFQDTLKVFLPTRPAAKPGWSLVYNRATDTYYLMAGKIRYELVKGLEGKQPLRVLN